jgi:hypothetical protein
MRCARSSEVGVLLGLLPLLVCASVNALGRARRRYINVVSSRGFSGNFVRWRGGRRVGALSGGSRRQS